MKDSARYTKIVEWSDEDNCYVGTSPGLFYGGCHGDDEQQVFAELCEIIDEWVVLFHRDGKPLPVPTVGQGSAEETSQQRTASIDVQTDTWKSAILETIDSHRRLAESAIAQLTDEELMRRPAEGVNSVAVIMRHMAGNLISRWTDFLTTDGEKPTRKRDAEFEDWPGPRASLERHFHVGWQVWRTAVESLTPDDLTKTVTIRGESHSVPLAIERSLTHTAYHVGQIMLVARLVHAGDWQWQTIRPGGSQQHNVETWVNAASREAAGKTPAST